MTLRSDEKRRTRTRLRNLLKWAGSLITAVVVRYLARWLPDL